MRRGPFAPLKEGTKRARLAKAKGAHDSLIASAHRLKADALEIEAQAARKLADEYDGAQERGEIKRAGNPNYSKTEELPGNQEISIPTKEIFEARRIRDAEETNPGIVKRVADKGKKK